MPIDQAAKQKDAEFKAAYSAKVNQMTEEFMRYFMHDNHIDWIKLVDFVSQRKEGKSSSQ